MKNPFITEIERTFNKSKVLNSKFQEIGDQPSILFDFLLNDAPQKGALFIAENDDFILLQIFVRYPHPIPSENVPQVLTALNGINSVSIAGFLMLTEEKNIQYIHYKSNLLLSNKSMEYNFPENELLIFINSNLNLIGAFNQELFEK